MEYHDALRKIARRWIRTLLPGPRQDAANRETDSIWTDSLSTDQIQHVQQTPTVCFGEIDWQSARFILQATIFSDASVKDWEQELTRREMDQKAAIMNVIEHLGDIPPGTKCSAVFFDTERIRREKEFYAKLYSENGVHDLAVLRAMVAANVPDDPYWLVSLKSSGGAVGDVTRLHRVDDRTGKILADPA